MQTLHEQLKEIEQQEFNEEHKFPQMKKLEVALAKANTIAGFAAFFSAIIIMYIFSILVFPNSKQKDLIVPYLYFGAFIFIFLRAIFTSFFQNIAHHFYKLNKKKYTNQIGIRSVLFNKKWAVRREIQKEEEQDFALRLNAFVYSLENKKFLLDEAKAINKKLEEDNNIIQRTGYQLYTNIYYNQ